MLATGLALVVALVWLGPVMLTVITSVKSNQDFLAGPFSLPTAPTLAPYVQVWEGLHFGVLMRNSLLYATLGSEIGRAHV